MRFLSRCTVFSNTTFKLLRDSRSVALPLPSLLRWAISNISRFVPPTVMRRKSKTVKGLKKVKNVCAMRVQIQSVHLHPIKSHRSSYPTSMTAIAVPCHPYHRCEPRTESWLLTLLTLLHESLPRDTKQFHHVQLTRGTLKGRKMGNPMKIGEEVCFIKRLSYAA